MYLMFKVKLTSLCHFLSLLHRSLALLIAAAVDVHVVQLVDHPWVGLQQQHAQGLGLSPRGGRGVEGVLSAVAISHSRSGSGWGRGHLR